MRVSLSWLAEFVALPATVDALVERLTQAGIEVEAIERVGDLDRGIRVGTIVAVDRHPQADRLTVCRIDVGESEPRVIVSAAPDLRPGRRVPVALPGARRPDGPTVAAVELRGVASTGVLCSESELGLGDDASGVLELPRTARPGLPLADLPGVRDTVLTLGLTPNRADCLSVLGIARDLAACNGLRVRNAPVRLVEAGVHAHEVIAVRIDAPDLCARYCARVVRGVRMVSSPLDVRLRLRRAGMRPINAVVDATNLVMLERGQPLHAFDLARIASGEIVVRRAVAGEPCTTLDGVARTLEGTDLVITDGRRPLAIAGVMGSQDSEVTSDTRDIVLESAFFAPSSIRRTGRRLGLLSQAAYRFERRVDPGMVEEALDRAAARVHALTGGAVAPGVVEDRGATADLDPPVIRVRPRRVAASLGIGVSRATIVRHLGRLGATTRKDGDAVEVVPPSWRGDLRIEADVTEEVARLEGYDRIPTTLPLAPIASGADSATRKAARRVRQLLAAEGLTELVTLAFTDAESNRLLPGMLDPAATPVTLANPLSSELGALRRSPVAGLLRATRLNQGHGATFVGAFEIGTTFSLAADGVPAERRVIAIVLTGDWPPCGAERSGPPTTFLDLKGVVANVLAGLGWAEGQVTLTPAADVATLHPGKAMRVAVEGQAVGAFGGLDPRVAQVLDLAGETWICELDFQGVALYGPRRSTVRAVPRFPAVTRDIAVIVDEAFPAGDILEELRALGDPLVESARLFDCYRGAPIPAGRKSLAYSIAYRAMDRTLTDDEVSVHHDRMRVHLAARFPLELRS